MKVTVSITTYNHEKFIVQAIDSALAQRVEFDYEVLIGEDKSSDRTRELVEDYAARYPGLIRLLCNDYTESHLRLNGKHNFANNILNARGEYIALLEGDDYWTDPLKLQKQVDFLEKHPECSACFHNVRVRHEEAPERDRNFHLAPLEKRFFALTDILSFHVIPTCSTVFRNGLIRAFPDWFYRLAMGDWPLHVLNAQHGLYGYVDDVMAVYRVHSGGIWSSSNRSKILESTIEAAEIIKAYLGDAYSRHMSNRIERWKQELDQELLRNDLRAGNFPGACARFFRTVMQRPSERYIRKGIRTFAQYLSGIPPPARNG